MPITADFESLTPLERAAVESVIPEPAEGDAKETVEEYLTRVGAGQAAIDSYVQTYLEEGTKSFAELGRQLFLAINTDPAKAEKLLPLVAQVTAILGVSE